MLPYRFAIRPALRATASLVVALALATPATGQERTASAEVESAVRAFYRGMSAGSADSVLAVISRDFQITGGGFTIDREAVRQQVARSGRGPVHTLSNFRTVVKDTVAETRYRRVVRDPRTGTPYPYEETVNLRRVSGKWLLVKLTGTQ
jgi:hypothetical protein